MYFFLEHIYNIYSYNCSRIQEKLHFSESLIKTVHLFVNLYAVKDRLCGLVVRVPVYRSGGSGFDSRSLQEEKQWTWNAVHSAS
jgi:hypothetical protein